jgi:hypothetical protein
VIAVRLVAAPPRSARHAPTRLATPVLVLDQSKRRGLPKAGYGRLIEYATTTVATIATTPRTITHATEVVTPRCGERADRSVVLLRARTVEMPESPNVLFYDCEAGHTERRTVTERLSRGVIEHDRTDGGE